MASYLPPNAPCPGRPPRVPHARFLGKKRTCGIGFRGSLSEQRPSQESRGDTPRRENSGHTREQPRTAPLAVAPSGQHRSEALQQSWADVHPSTQPYVTFPALHERRDLVDMDHRITHASHRKVYLRLLTWVRARLGLCGERIFAASDNAARHHGWQIAVTQAGLGRRYRDPRFDSLAACPPCGGRGARTPGDPCRACEGTGRVTITARTAAQASPRRPA